MSNASLDQQSQLRGYGSIERRVSKLLGVGATIGAMLRYRARPPRSFGKSPLAATRLKARMPTAMNSTAPTHMVG